MKQTSIEWLVNFFEEGVTSVEEWTKAKEQAKQMHKQEIIDAFGIGCHHESKRLVGYQDVAEQYYNETYKKD